jgi:3-oxoacyl-[acyl-carrier protein] reductase
LFYYLEEIIFQEGKTMRLKDKVVIITGASKGIGKSIAFALAEEGASLALCSRNTDAINNYIPELSKNSGKLSAYSCDVTKEEDIKNVVDGVLQQFGKIDILINNAGVWITDLVAESSVADFATLMGTNYMGTYMFTRYALPSMVENNKGDIINISSILGQFGAVSKSGYCASKFAVMGFSEALRNEVKKNNIRVIVVCPGTTDTDLFGGPVDAEKSLSPDDVAETIRLALVLPRRATINEITITPTYQ